MGQDLVLRSLSSQDWHPRTTTDGIIQRVINKAAVGDIILRHDSGSLLGGKGSDRRRIVDVLGSIIDGLRAKGLEIVGLEEMMSCFAKT